MRNNHVISLLSYACGGLATLYVVLLITTVTLATWQTALTASVRDTESNISTLETTYYQTITRLNTTDPHAVGFVTPNQVVYVAATHAAALSFAGK